MTNNNCIFSKLSKSGCETFNWFLFNLEFFNEVIINDIYFYLIFENHAPKNISDYISISYLVI